jgi:transcriptional regulator of acetoin/glycerol metabolism
MTSRSRSSNDATCAPVLADSATLEEAAARLGINPTTLWRMRKRWGLD